jgi:hypothetical protein
MRNALWNIWHVLFTDGDIYFNRRARLRVAARYLRNCVR